MSYENVSNQPLYKFTDFFRQLLRLFVASYPCSKYECSLVVRKWRYYEMLTQYVFIRFIYQMVLEDFLQELCGVPYVPRKQ